MLRFFVFRPPSNAERIGDSLYLGMFQTHFTLCGVV